MPETCRALSQNKFEKLVHLVVDARSPERQMTRVVKLDWSVCICLTQIYAGRDM